MFELLKKRFRRGYQHFCEKTSMHGFSEIYHSKSWTWTAIWILVVVGGIGLTAHQVYQTTCQYLEQTTNTVIGPVAETDMYYPPIHLCYWQWYFWVDLDKVAKLNCSKDALLYSLRYFNSIYSSTLINFDQAKRKFNEVMNANNFTSLFDFYNSIARTVPIVSDNNFTEYFDRAKIFYKDPYMLFCYEVSAENMIKYFSRNIHSKLISFNTMDESYKSVSKLVDVHEYNNYILRWADKSSMYKITKEANMSLDLTQFAPPISLFLFGVVLKGLEMVPENDAYLIDVRASVFTWQNKNGNLCDENKREISSANTTCQNLCEAEFRRKACTCLRLDQAILLNITNLESVCKKDTIFLNFTNKNLSNDTVKEMKRSPYECSSAPEVLQFWHKCMNDCVPACQIWKYEKSVATKTTSTVLRQYGKKTFTKIYLEYPSGKDVVVMTVEDAQSWENFIGNVGGLLGIWTGASILSFLQLFYLCCCADCEGCCCWPQWYLCKNQFKQRQTNRIHSVKNFISSQYNGDIP